MKTSLLACSVLLLSFISGKQHIDDVPAIKEVIQEAYVDGIFNEGYLRSIELSFSDHFESIGLLENDETVVETIDQWMTMVRERKANGYYPVPVSDRVTVRYLHIELSRSVANVKLEFRVGGKPTYIDFLALYKFSGGWKVVNRTYHAIEQEDKDKK